MTLFDGPWLVESDYKVGILCLHPQHTYLSLLSPPALAPHPFPEAHPVASRTKFSRLDTRVKFVW
jgi:hypothetical protein